ncbi:hypothetical protein PT974_04920 [Cladobotryum mycophilum]|uniref:Aminoglycoside phosphotransferase domain-containing protein n=1 Tax=Cladobotryum mycophilum TaxID=491253 RepID=A0ABR0SRU8_9HYPO
MGGKIVFGNDGEPSGIGPSRELDENPMPKELMRYRLKDMPVYIETGPFLNTEEFYTRLVGKEDGLSVFSKGQQRLLMLFIGCIVDFFKVYEGSFVLAHPDFDIQNFIVSPDGDLVGIIDWNGVSVRPHSVGNLKYPGWLTRDLDPGMNGDGSDGVREDPYSRDDSPETLAAYRHIYAGIIAEILAAEKQRMGLVSRREADANVTRATLLTESISIAASSRMDRGNIIRKIVEKIGTVVEVPGNFDRQNLYMDLCNLAGEDLLGPETEEALKAEFKKLLGTHSL